MEEESFQNLNLSDSKSIYEGLENVFLTMIKEGQILDALDFIRSMEADILPSKTVIHTIIFKILMVSDDVKCLAFAYDYLMTVLNTFPPSNDENGQFYYESIIDTQGFLSDLWNVFSHVVNSYLCHREVYAIAREGSDVIKYPNCKFLLEFYVKLFEVDFHYRCSEKFTHCLVVKLLWPKSDPTTSAICLSHRTESLFKYIDHAYERGFINAMVDFLGCMHDILTLMVKSFILSRSVSNYQISANALSDSSVFSHPALAEIVEALTNFCKNAYGNLQNTKLFLNLLSLKYLRAKVSEKIIRQIIKLSSKRSYVVTLRDIVDHCMFPSKFNKWKNTKPNVNKEKNLRKRPDKRMLISDKKMEATKLHELCQKNKFADLCLLLQQSPSEDINARNSAGLTPLHLACQAGYHLCVQVLLDAATEGPQSLDCTAANFEGFTPLHLAVMNDYVDIAKKILDYGGAELLLLTNNQGQKPEDLCISVPMNKMLQEYIPEVKDSIELSCDSAPADNGVREAPSLKTFKDYSIYLHALNCLLCSYCDLCNLIDYIWLKNTSVASHSDKKCCHFESNGSTVCSEDAALISDIPNIIDTFIQSILKNVSKAENSINVDIELIPLKAFAASLKIL